MNYLLAAVVLWTALGSLENVRANWRMQRAFPAFNLRFTLGVIIYSALSFLLLFASGRLAGIV